MNTLRVSRNAARKPGMILTLIFALVMVKHLSAEMITITATGTVSRPSPDYLHLFNNQLKEGVPFTLVFTFDDSKGQATKFKGCQASGINGRGTGSPGTGTLTISGKSVTIGTTKNASSEIKLEVTSGCSSSHLYVYAANFYISGWGGTIVTLDVVPLRPRLKPFTKELDWKGNFFSDSVLPDESTSGFTIQGPNATGDQGFLIVKTVSVKRGA